MADARDAADDNRVARWLAALESRYLADLRFAEASRALRALSSAYVERRDKLGSGAALDGAGKRAAFALFYGPLHFLTVQRIVRDLGAAQPAITGVSDLGCGTGSAGAAWALECDPPAAVLGVERHPWAAAEARWTFKTLGLAGSVRNSDVLEAKPPASGTAVVAAFVLNELPVDRRRALFARIMHAASEGARVLIVEPIAKRASPWWAEASRAVQQAGGRDDEWRFAMALPDIVRRLDRAAGLRHDVLTARSLYLAGHAGRGTADSRQQSVDSRQ